jgi:hypothetical protein
MVIQEDVAGNGGASKVGKGYHVVSE